jgi:type IV secretory pathway VirB4 component
LAPAGTTAHETTTRNVGALYPLLRDTGSAVPGAFIGVDLLGGAFAYDPFELYAAGRLTSPNALVFGQIGRGKSALVKTYVLRQLAFGRTAFILDPKGEYGSLASAVGIRPLDLRPGGPLRLNPLEIVSGEDAATTAARLELLEALAASATGRSLGPRERAAIDAALGSIDHGDGPPTIPEVVRALFEPSPEAARQLGTSVKGLAEEGRDVALALRRLVHGDLAGMFDAPTSVDIDLAAPLVVLDLSALYGSAALGLFMICAAAWLQSIIRRRAQEGRRVIFVIDEAWAVLRDLAVARWVQASWKLSRAWGVSNLAVLHRLSDLRALGAEGSEERELAEGILLDSETRVIYAQPPGEVAAAAELLGLSEAERELLPRLGRGIGLWKVGGRPSLVRHLLGPGEAALVDSDATMRER